VLLLRPAASTAAASPSACSEAALGKTGNASAAAGPTAALTCADKGDAVVTLPVPADPTSAASTPFGREVFRDGLVFMSVPGEHSRKPHLGHLMEAFLPHGTGASSDSKLYVSGAQGECSVPKVLHDRGGATGRQEAQLELFARELRDGWDSVGDEVLHFQQVLGGEGECTGGAGTTQKALTVVLPCACDR